jgi:glycosyltransferase involved in cell wall biosynthesis
MRKLKVLYLYPFGGLNPKHSSQVMGLSILDQLIKRNFSVYIIPRDSEEKKAGVRLGLKIIEKEPDFLINRLLFTFLLIKPFRYGLNKIGKIIKNENIDVIFERHSLWNMGYYLSKKTGIPYVTNDVMAYPFFKYYYKGLQKIISTLIPKVFFKKMENKSFLHAKSIISHSTVYTKILKDEFNVDPKAIFQFYAMVDKTKFDIKDKSIVCSQLGIDSSNFNVVFVGSFDKPHSPYYMIQLIRNLKDLHIRFILIGDGPLLSSFQNQIRKLKLDDKVLFTGRLNHDKVVEYIQASDLGIESSWDKRAQKYGGDSIKIYEYLACGKPVIASDLPGQIQMLKNKAAILINPTNLIMFSDAVKTFYNDKILCQKYGRNARMVIEDNWNWEYTGNIIEKAIKNAY